MPSSDEFVELLTEFDLSRKEARVFLQLLKYGPQPAAVIAQELKTYREDVHRTLRQLLNKGLTHQSLSKPVVHAAKPLKDALDAALRHEAIELQRKEEVKRELIRIAPRQRPFPSDKFCSYQVVRGCKECIAASLEQAEAAKHDILTIGHATALAYSHKQGYFKTFLDAVGRGVDMRFILDITPDALDAVCAAVEGGVDVRHCKNYRGIMFTLVDFHESFTVVTFDVHKGPTDTEHTAFLCNNPKYARNLAYQFESIRTKSKDGVQQIRELTSGESSFSTEQQFDESTP